MAKDLVEEESVRAEGDVDEEEEEQDAFEPTFKSPRPKRRSLVAANVRGC